MRRRLRARAEAGDTLVEVLIAVAIMGIAMVAILSGLAVAANSSSQHRAQATANTLLVSSVESVKAATYVSCATTSSYPTTSGVTVPAGWNAAVVTDVKHWDGTSFASSCPLDRKLQLITIQVSSPDGKATESVAVVKRNPA